VHKGQEYILTLTPYLTLTLMLTRPFFPNFRKLSEVEGKCELKIGAALKRAQVCTTSLTLTLTQTLALTKCIAQAKAKRELDILINTNKTKEDITTKKVSKPRPEPTNHPPSPLPCALNLDHSH
jgi:hypothetical protein